jgi:hypothetical protein
MDQFTVPKFIEHKPKIVGPLTFQQFIFIGIAAGTGFILYFTAPFQIFLVTTIILVGGGSALAFVKIEGRPLPEVLKNLFRFSFAPKLYLWKKKVGPPPKLMKETRPRPGQIRETPTPTIVGKSHLKNLSTQIETKSD